MKSIFRQLARRLARFADDKPGSSPELRFALNEISDMRQQLRTLLSESVTFQAFIAQNAKSFDVQWDRLPKGVHMIGDPIFDRESVQLVEKYSGLPAIWFANKTVLDAGCGNGRWCYTLARLGARVTAIDLSEAGTEDALKLCSEFPEFKAYRHDLFKPLGQEEKFDFVWNLGSLTILETYSADAEKRERRGQA